MIYRWFIYIYLELVFILYMSLWLLASNYSGDNYFLINEAGFCRFCMYERLMNLGITNIYGVIQSMCLPWARRSYARPMLWIVANWPTSYLSVHLKRNYILGRKPQKYALYKTKKPDCKRQHTYQEPYQVFARFYGVEISRMFARCTIS